MLDGKKKKSNHMTSTRKTKKLTKKGVKSKVKISGKSNILNKSKTLKSVKDTKIYTLVDDDRLNKLFVFSDSIKQILIKYQYITKQIQVHKLDSIGNIKSYHYSNLDEVHNEFKKLYDNILKFHLKYKVDELHLKKVIHTTEDYARGVSAYIMQTYKMKHKVSNGFVKLWEIYNTFNILPNKKKVKVFHLAEAPGQWINCTNYFLLTKRFKVEEYDWRATSLNPKNSENIEKYGKGIFGHRDEYGFLKKYSKQWIWGADDTGDITKTENIKWYREYCKKWSSNGNSKIDLITGDAGIQSDDIIVNQKLEYSQLFMVIATASYGSNCVIKHFLPYMVKIQEAKHSGGYFVNLIYLYYILFETVYLIKPMTSNPNSGEFYVVAKNFRGINEKHFNKLLGILDNFQPNQCIFPEKEIPEEFVKQIIEFNKTIFDNIIHNYNIKNDYYYCLTDNKKEKSKLNCKKFIDSKYMMNVRKQKFNEWVKKFNFE